MRVTIHLEIEEAVPPWQRDVHLRNVLFDIAANPSVKSVRSEISRCEEIEIRKNADGVKEVFERTEGE
jgi:hypothetical protein